MEIQGQDPTAFKITQGNVVSPMTFDVNNACEGKVMFALPHDLPKGGPGVYFTYPTADPKGLMQVVKNNMDDFSFIYMAPQAGWLVVHQPFDPKWEVLVDGKKVPLYKANRSFIAFEIPQGKHTVCLRYWPHTPIRFLLGLSIIVSTICLLWILWVAVAAREKIVEK